jgi:hypothetical protein
MRDLHNEAKSSKDTAQIDTVGWIFLFSAIGIIGLAAAVAYNGDSTILVNEQMSLAAR